MNLRDMSMADIPTQNLLSPSLSLSKPQSMRAWHWAALGGIVSLSLFLNFTQLQQNGYGNIYYATAVKSMLINWHNFFFVSFDPNGFVSVDKPPVGLWLQTFCAKLFGFSSFSLFLPQALAGVLAGVVLFHIVRRSFGPPAGLLAALALAITPMGVAASRNNNLDMLLVLVVLLATWAVARAVEKGQLTWLLLGAVLVGIGFNVKMLEAYLVVPALGLFYLLAAPRKWWLRAVHLALALALLLLVSFSWMTAVDLTPSTQRPYVGSSQKNSEFELALGYNGINRLFQVSGPEQRTLRQSSATVLALFQLFATDAQQADRNTVTSNNSGTSKPGPLRLFIEPFGGQVSWLLPLALLTVLALAWQNRRRGPLNQQQQALVLWGTWLFTMLVAFSIAVHMLIYYTVMMIPAISALAGIGLVVLWRNFRVRTSRDWQGWLLPFALVATGIFQVALLVIYPDWSAWLSPLIVTFVVLSAITMGGSRAFIRSHPALANISRIAVVCGTLTVLVTPFIWSSVSLTYPGNGSSPGAGPPAANAQATFLQEPSGSYTLNKNQQTLLLYLLANKGNAQFILGTINAATASPFILASGQPVMALGGFSGSDPILTKTHLAAIVGNGTLRFFLLSFDVKGSGQTTKLVYTGGNVTLAHWIITNCIPVALHVWEPGYFTPVVGKPGEREFHPTGNKSYTSQGAITNRLYDCAKMSA